MPIKEIAAVLGVGRNRVGRALRIASRRHGLPAPDGRTLRKLRRQRYPESDTILFGGNQDGNNTTVKPNQSGCSGVMASGPSQATPEQPSPNGSPIAT
jgi:hypothetical protein